jgi:hypothetical protein
MRRNPEADEFPWNRQLDFDLERSQATWDDSIYDQTTLDEMEAVRMRNKEKIDSIDRDDSTRQRECSLCHLQIHANFHRSSTCGEEEQSR